MEKLIVTILHKLPNRVRLRTSKPIKNKENFCNFVKQETSNTKIKYNKVSNTLLITFNPQEILLQELIYKAIMAFSIENGLQSVKMVQEQREKTLENLSIYSIGAIGVAGIHKILNKNNLDIQDTLNMFAMGITSVAIGEHGFYETKKRGYFDVEILPAVYLIKSFLTSKSLSIVAIIWLTTFGRHLFSSEESTKNIKLFRLKDEKNGGYIYSLESSEDKSINNINDLFYHLILKNNKQFNRSNDKYMLKSSI